MSAQISEGDTLKTPNGTVTVEQTGLRGGRIKMSDGQQMTYGQIEQGIQTGRVDLIPAGTAERDTYIRFGDLPENERSTDHSSGRKESGVSVYAAESDTPDDSAETDADEAHYLAGTELQTVFYLLDRPVYLVSGERVGTGADGEPLIRDCEIEAELTTPKGCGGFIPREDA